MKTKTTITLELSSDELAFPVGQAEVDLVETAMKSLQEVSNQPSTRISGKLALAVLLLRQWKAEQRLNPSS